MLFVSLFSVLKFCIHFLWCFISIAPLPPMQTDAGPSSRDQILQTSGNSSTNFSLKSIRYTTGIVFLQVSHRHLHRECFPCMLQMGHQLHVNKYRQTMVRTAQTSSESLLRYRCCIVANQSQAIPRLGWESNGPSTLRVTRPHCMSIT